MNTTEILNKSLAWLYYKEIKPVVTGPLSAGTLPPKVTRITGYDFYDKNNQRRTFSSESKSLVNQAAEVVSLSQVAPQELHILTQVILNTLNTEPARFHDMMEIPGLENRDWNQLGQVALYLLKQGWIEAKSTANGFLIKLSIEGKIYLGHHEGWA